MLSVETRRGHIRYRDRARLAFQHILHNSLKAHKPNHLVQFCINLYLYISRNTFFLRYGTFSFRV